MPDIHLHILLFYELFIATKMWNQSRHPLTDEQKPSHKEEWSGVIQKKEEDGIGDHNVKRNKSNSAQ